MRDIEEYNTAQYRGKMAEVTYLDNGVEKTIKDRISLSFDLEGSCYVIVMQKFLHDTIIPISNISSIKFLKKGEY